MINDQYCIQRIEVFAVHKSVVVFHVWEVIVDALDVVAFGCWKDYFGKEFSHGVGNSIISGCHTTMNSGCAASCWLNRHISRIMLTAQIFTYPSYS